jgi:hypothetical protein
MSSAQCRAIVVKKLMPPQNIQEKAHYVACLKQKNNTFLKSVVHLYFYILFATMCHKLDSFIIFKMSLGNFLAARIFKEIRKNIQVQDTMVINNWDFSETYYPAYENIREIWKMELNFVHYERHWDKK